MNSNQLDVISAPLIKKITIEEVEAAFLNFKNQLMKSENISTNQLYKVYLMYFTISSSFGLPANLIEDSVLDKCERIYTSVIKNKYYLPKTFSNQRLQTLSSHSGMVIISLKDFIGIECLVLFIRYIRSTKRIGKIYRAQVEWYEFHAGFPITVLQLRSEQPQYCEKFWLKSVLNFMNRYNIRIDIQPKHTIYREYNEFIMAKAGKCYTDTSILRSINSVRLKLGAMTLSNLFDGNGTLIDLNIFTRKELNKILTLSLPIHITQKDIIIWTNFMLHLGASKTLRKWYKTPSHQ